MKSTPVLRWIAIVTVSAMSACSLLVPLDDYASGSTGSLDAGDDAIASGDAAVSDAGKADAPGDLCRTFRGTFCADFERGTLLEGWTGEDVETPGGHELAMSPSLSRALLSKMPRRSTRRARVSLNKRFDGDFRHFVFDADLHLPRPDWMDGDVNAAVLVIGLVSGSSSREFYVTVGEKYVDVGFGGNTVTADPVPFDRPFHVHIDVDPAKQWDAEIAGEHFHRSIPTPIVATEAPSTDFRLGITGFNAPAPTFAIYYDNVTIDFR